MNGLHLSDLLEVAALRSRHNKAQYRTGRFEEKLAKAESDLSAAREEIAALRKALDQIAHLRPAGPTKNKLVEQMERIALEALRSSRTKGDPS